MAGAPEITADEVLAILGRHQPIATYVIRNWLAGGDYLATKVRRPGLKTSKVLRLLRKLERAGVVRQVPSSYAVMLTWALPEPIDQVGVPGDVPL